MITASGAEQIRTVMLVSMDFSSGFLRVNSSNKSIVFSGDTYTGVGDLGKIEDIEESINHDSQGIRLTLSGVPSAHISRALGEHYQGRAILVYLALLDSIHELIADPTTVFSGRMDTMPIDAGDTATIMLTAESFLADWDRPRVGRYNDADQQDRYTGDVGLEFLPQTTEKELVWGKG